MLVKRTISLLVMGMFVTTLLFVFTPDSEAGADKKYRMKQIKKYVVSGTGEWCYTQTTTWPDVEMTNTPHYNSWHSTGNMNPQHGYYLTTIEHEYTYYVSSCPG